MKQKTGICSHADLEDFQRCQPTLAVFKKLKAEYTNIGTVIQAYLYWFVKDIDELTDFHLTSIG